MQVTKCLLLDDEPLALDVLENYIRQFSHLQLAARFSNPLEAISFMKTNSVDLLFLDIKMPVLSGINLLKTLLHPPKVILTTAYRDYAVESYDLNVLDYLLKPISLERFVIAINKYKPESSEQPLPEPSRGNQNHSNNSERFIYFKSNKKMVKVFMKDILWIESLKDYVKIVTRQQTIVSYERISYLEEKLPENMFVRIHRSFIVATHHIKSFNSASIQIGDTELPIGRIYKNEVLKYFSSISGS